MEGAMTLDQLTEVLEQTADNAAELWKASVMGAIVDLAVTRQPFTADEVHQLVDQTGYTTPTENAMGAMFARAARAGIIKTNNQYRPSTRPEAHRRMVRIWEGV